MSINKHDPKKDKTAVAISYDPSEEAPKVIAAGKGYIADKIMNRAEEAQIPIYQDSQLANTLSKLEIGSNIPPELYEIVAQILVFVDKMDRLKSKVDQNYE